MKKQNKAEAQRLIENIVNEHKQLSYDELCTWIKQKKVETKDFKGPSGVEYQVELAAMWDAKPTGTIRFSGSIYDDSASRFFRIKTPSIYDFLKEK
jgi:hypothetical protein